MPWTIVSSTVIGARHEEEGTPCQDCHLCQTITTERGQFLIAAAADGAGSAPHSDRGAAVACSDFLAVARAALVSGGFIALTKDYLITWIVSHQEKLSRLALGENRKIRDYAHTFLGVVVGEGKAMYLQIGDGAIVISNELDEFEAVFWPQRGEFANETYFLTDPLAIENLRFEQRDNAPDALAIFTDGLQHLVLDYRQRLPHRQFFNSYLNWVRSGEENQEVDRSAQLAEYLASAEINQKTNDDKTLILAALRDSLLSSRA